MQRMAGCWRSRSTVRAELGAAAVEYALVVSGVVGVVLFGVNVFGSLLDARWTSFNSWLGL